MYESANVLWVKITISVIWFGLFLRKSITLFGYNPNVNNIIKWVEIAFIGYYVYSFVLSLRNGFSLPKVFLNLLIIFQSITSLLNSKPRGMTL